MMYVACCATNDVTDKGETVHYVFFGRVQLLVKWQLSNKPGQNDDFQVFSYAIDVDNFFYNAAFVQIMITTSG